MPQGKVVEIRPGLDVEDTQLRELLASLEAENSIEYKTGEIITCKKNAGDDIQINEVLPFVVPEAQFPAVRTGKNCKDRYATTVKFKFKKEKGYKYIYEVTL